MTFVLDRIHFSTDEDFKTWWNEQARRLENAMNAAVTRLYYTGQSVALPATTTETTLQSYTLPANTLITNGQLIRVSASGTFVTNANTKTVRLYFGSTAVATTSVTSSFSQWTLDGRVIRVGAASELSFFNILTGPSVQNTAAETLANPVLIKLTGQNTAASADITCNALSIELIP